MARQRESAMFEMHRKEAEEQRRKKFEEEKEDTLREMVASSENMWNRIVQTTMASIEKQLEDRMHNLESRIAEASAMLQSKQEGRKEEEEKEEGLEQEREKEKKNSEKVSLNVGGASFQTLT